MSNKNMTAVEWLQSIEMERDLTLGDWSKAKEMEKQQIMDAFINGEHSLGEDEEYYYKENYEN